MFPESRGTLPCCPRTEPGYGMVCRCVLSCCPGSPATVTGQSFAGPTHALVPPRYTAIYVAVPRLPRSRGESDGARAPEEPRIPPHSARYIRGSCRQLSVGPAHEGPPAEPRKAPFGGTDGCATWRYVLGDGLLSLAGRAVLLARNFCWIWWT